MGGSAIQGVRVSIMAGKQAELLRQHCIQKGEEDAEQRLFCWDFPLLWLFSGFTAMEVMQI